MTSQGIKVAVLGTRGIPGVQGGIEAHCEQLYPRLAGLGCRITIYTRGPRVDSSLKSYKGVELVAIDCPKSRYFEAIIHTFKGVLAAKNIHPDLLHIHAVGPSLIIPLARIFGFKVVMTDHGPDYQRAKWGFLAKLALRCGEASAGLFANEMICISKTIADDIKRKFHRDSFVIPNGVEIPERSRSEETLGKYSLEKGKYVLAVGRFVPEKGFKDLVAAFDAAGLTEYKLVIAGSADHESEYSRALEASAAHSRDIVLTGFLTGEPLRELYSHAGLFVLPSYYEGLPIVLLEAMSYGLPCLASDIPANRNVDLPEECYFEPGNIEQMSQIMKECIVNPFAGIRKNLQLDELRKKYSWDTVAKETLRVYTKALGAPASPSGKFS